MKIYNYTEPKVAKQDAFPSSFSAAPPLSCQAGSPQMAPVHEEKIETETNGTIVDRGLRKYIND